MPNKKTMSKKTPQELKLLQDFANLQGNKTQKVLSMETLVRDFDTESILKLNQDLREYYATVGDTRMLGLIDRMTSIMRELTEIIHQVKAKRISLELAQKEILEKLDEINEVLQTMKDWEATGI